MAGCDEAVILISACLDGELSAEEQAALKGHLSLCPSCAALFAELKGLHQAAASLEELPAPPDLAEKVMASIAAQSAQEEPGGALPFSVKKASPWKKWAACAAVAAVVLLGAAGLPNLLGNMASRDAGSSGGSSFTNSFASGGAAPESAPDLAESVASAQSDLDGGSVSYDGGSMTAYSGSNGLAGAITSDSSEATAATQDTAAAAGAGPTEGGMLRDGGDAEEPVPEQAASPTPAPSYCGVLTLSDAALPKGLDELKRAADRGGRETYLLPADDFFALLKELQAGPDDAYHLETGETDAQYGLIIVAPPG